MPLSTTPSLQKSRLGCTYTQQSSDRQREQQQCVSCVSQQTTTRRGSGLCKHNCDCMIVSDWNQSLLLHYAGARQLNTAVHNMHVTQVAHLARHASVCAHNVF
jgi:hypothetical protein